MIIYFFPNAFNRFGTKRVFGGTKTDLSLKKPVFADENILQVSLFESYLKKSILNFIPLEILFILVYNGIKGGN